MLFMVVLLSARRRPPHTLIAFGTITIVLAIKAQVVSDDRHSAFDASVFVSSHFISSFSPGPLRGLSGTFCLMKVVGAICRPYQSGSPHKSKKYDRGSYAAPTKVKDAGEYEYIPAGVTNTATSWLK